MNDIFDVVIYGTAIEYVIFLLNEIIESDNAMFLRLAAFELKNDMESKSKTFFIEASNMIIDFSLSTGDSIIRMKFAELNGWFALIIADIAITDHVFAVSKVGASYLKAYTYGTISKISANSLKNKSEGVPVNGTEYTNIKIGEYILYGVDKSQEYINKLKCLCLARSLGEEEIMNMEFWNSKLWVLINGNKYFFETVEENISLTDAISNKY